MLFVGIFDTTFTYNDNVLIYLIMYFGGNILFHSLYRGFWSTRPCWKKFNDGGNWELYFGIGNVTSPYLGAVLNLAVVCKPNFILKHLPRALQDKVTIHIVDFKPLNLLLGSILSLVPALYGKIYNAYIRPQFIVGLFTVEINLFKYWDVSLNLGSLILDIVQTMIRYHQAKKSALDKNLKSAFDEDKKQYVFLC